MDAIDDMRKANYEAWKKKHDAEVKKCECKVPNPSPTDKNTCFECKGEIYKDWFKKIRWFNKK